MGNQTRLTGASHARYRAHSACTSNDRCRSPRADGAVPVAGTGSPAVKLDMAGTRDIAGGLQHTGPCDRLSWRPHARTKAAPPTSETPT